MTLEQMYKAGIFPPRLDRALLADGTRLSREDIDVIRARLNKEHGRTKIKMPRLKLGGSRRKASGLGVALGEIKVGKGA